MMSTKGMMKKVLLTTSILFAVTSVVNCGGEEGYTDTEDHNRGWVTIDTPSDASAYETRNKAVELGGYAFISHIEDDPTDWYARLYIPRETGVRVHYRNETTGESAELITLTAYRCFGYLYFSFCEWEQRWGAEVDLADGGNNILVTASDGLGNHGEDRISVIHPLLHAPTINSFTLSILSTTSLKCDVEVDTGGLDTEVRFAYNASLSPSVLVPAAPEQAALTYTLTGLVGDMNFVWPVVSNRLGTETGAPVDSRLRQPDLREYLVYGTMTYNEAEVDLEATIYTGGLETTVWVELYDLADHRYLGTIGRQVLPASDAPVEYTVYDRVPRPERYLIVSLNAQNSAGKMRPNCSIPSQDGDLYITCN